MKGVIGLFVMIMILLKFSEAKYHGPGPGKKPIARFDKAFNYCSGEENQRNSYTNELNHDSICKGKPFDYNCIFKCMNLECYNDIYSHQPLEFGEMDYPKRSNFEKCFLAKTQVKKIISDSNTNSN
jgi:hypothetical protein